MCALQNLLGTGNDSGSLLITVLYVFSSADAVDDLVV